MGWRSYVDSARVQKSSSGRFISRSLMQVVGHSISSVPRRGRRSSGSCQVHSFRPLKVVGEAYDRLRDIITGTECTVFTRTAGAPGLIESGHQKSCGTLVRFR